MKAIFISIESFHEFLKIKRQKKQKHYLSPPPNPWQTLALEYLTLTQNLTLTLAHSGLQSA